MKYQNKAKELKNTFRALPSAVERLAVEADKEIEDLKEKNANLLKHIKGVEMLVKNLRANKRVIE